jgi:hypothetical protein
MIGGQHVHVERAGGELLHRLFRTDHAGRAVDVAIGAGHVVHHTDADHRPRLGLGAPDWQGGGAGGGEKRAAGKAHWRFPLLVTPR